MSKERVSNNRIFNRKKPSYFLFSTLLFSILCSASSDTKGATLFAVAESIKSHKTGTEQSFQLQQSSIPLKSQTSEIEILASQQNEKVEADQLFHQVLPYLSYYSQGNTQQLESAVKKLQQALVLYKKIGDSQGQINTLNLIGDIHMSLATKWEPWGPMPDLTKKEGLLQARAPYTDALTVSRQTGDFSGQLKALSALGRIASALHELPLAINYARQALDVVRQIDQRFLPSHPLPNTPRQQIPGQYTQYSPMASWKAGILSELQMLFWRQKNYSEAIKAAQEEVTLSQNQPNDWQSLRKLSGMYFSLKNYPQAIKTAQEALKALRKQKNPWLEMMILTDLSLYNYKAGNHQAEKVNHQQLIERSQQPYAGWAGSTTGTSSQNQQSSSGKAMALLQLASGYRYISAPSRVIELSQQALDIARKEKNSWLEISCLTTIGDAYLWTGPYHKATDYFQQAVALSKQNFKTSTELDVGRIQMLISLSNANLRFGRYAEAMKYLQQARESNEKMRAKQQEFQRQYEEQQRKNNLPVVPQGNTMHGGFGFDYTFTIETGIATIYSRLGQYQKAIELYNNVISSIQDDDWSNRRLDKYGALIGLGLSYKNLGKNKDALKVYQQAIDLLEAPSIWGSNEELMRNWKALTLQARGQSYQSLGQYQQAIVDFQEASLIFHQIGDRGREANALNNLGKAYSDLKNDTQAMLAYQQSLILSHEIGDRPTEATTFDDLGRLYMQQNQPQLAIVFLKQSVSTYEAIREDLQKLPKEQQESYTQTVASTYRRLADLLLQQDRILEAQQVLDLLKVQELEGYLQNVRGVKQKLIVVRQEVDILEKYKVLQQGAIAAGNELAELEKRSQALSAVEKKRKDKLVELRQQLNQQFNNFMASEEVQKLVKQLTPTEIEARLTPDVLRGAGKTMAQLNAVLLYPLVLDDRLELIITAPNAQPLRRTVKGVGREELNKAIVEFRTNLHPSRNPKRIAQKLYDWLIKPIEADLRSANVKTIIYAPDGQLRYIPLAALHDGQQWLIEHYQINNITAKAVDKLVTQPRLKPRILAGAFGTADKAVTVAGRDFNFAGLDFTTKEVELLAKLLPDTRTMLDLTFTVRETINNMNDYTIVHLATHAALVPEAADQSFILFRDGVATLKDIDNWTLDNVDLIVLSACETGLGGKFGNNGEEVLGLGYQFTKQDKARAAIASLWQVNDGGTQQLMNAFYAALKQGMTKAQALQAAQKALITGEYSTVGGKRADIGVVDSGTGQPLTISSDSLNHPYYWAPFILIGNGL